tara:strand:+ start:1149 stop:1610 length:462 start_codon:yes stop_codon:yes gene_type:complete
MAAFNSDRGSIADRMKSLHIRSTLISKQDPTAVTTNPPGQDLTNMGAVGGNTNPMTPAPTNTKAYMSDLNSQLGTLATLLGSWPATEALLLEGGYDPSDVMPIKLSVDQFRAQISNLQTELGLLRQQMKVKQLETYDTPMPVNNASVTGGAPF